MGRYGIKTPPQHGSWADFLDTWRVADQTDVIDSAWNFDHFYPLTEPLDGTCLEGWTMLAALAQATTRLKIGSMVNGMHYRHPAVTANMAATVDHISGGRLQLGLGAGWMEPESNAYGIALGTLAERSDRFEEGVEVVVSLLENEFTTFDGRYYQLVDARCEPKSVQQPRPPIVIGGKGRRRTLRTAARFADHWDMTFPPSVDAFRELDEVLQGHCEVVGRDHTEIERSIHLAFSVDSDVDALVAEAQPFFAAGVDLVIFSMRGPYRGAEIERLAGAIERAG